METSVKSAIARNALPMKTKSTRTYGNHAGLVVAAFVVFNQLIVAAPQGPAPQIPEGGGPPGPFPNTSVSAANVIAKGSSVFDGRVEVPGFDGQGPIAWSLNRYNRGDFALRLAPGDPVAALGNLGQGFIDFRITRPAWLPVKHGDPASRLALLYRLRGKTVPLIGVMAKGLFILLWRFHGRPRVRPTTWPTAVFLPGALILIPAELGRTVQVRKQTSVFQPHGFRSIKVGLGATLQGRLRRGGPVGPVQTHTPRA